MGITNRRQCFVLGDVDSKLQLGLVGDMLDLCGGWCDADVTTEAAIGSSKRPAMVVCALAHDALPNFADGCLLGWPTSLSASQAGVVHPFPRIVHCLLVLEVNVTLVCERAPMLALRMS